MSGRNRWTAWVSAAVLVTGTTVLLPAGVASAAPAGATRTISSAGSTSFASAGRLGSGALQFPEFPTTGPSDAGPGAFDGTIVDRSRSRRDGKGGNGQSGRRDDNNVQITTSVDGLTLRDQRLANNGNQFSLEPPDQGLCTGNGFVLESVNDVLNVYDQAGKSRLGITDLNTFYGYPAQIDRASGLQGAFVTDPSCLFDAPTQRWFQVALTLEVVPDTGDFTGVNTLDIAVSRTASPLGAWTIYHLPITDDGTAGTPNHRCNPGPGAQPAHPNACLGDYPHIGADENGFYVTTNEYDFFGPGFHAAQVYALSKAALAASAATLTVSQFDTVGEDRGNPGFTLFPAGSPGRQFEKAAAGTEYLMSSNAADEANGTHVSSDVLVWALTNTRSLNDATPAVSLDHTVVGVGRYAVPPLSDQKPGDFPLGQCINDTTAITLVAGQPGCWRGLFTPDAEPAHNEVETALDSSDTRMHQVVFAGGRLWGALDTALTLNGTNKAAIEWFTVTPKARPQGVTARVERSGYLGLANNNLTYPAIGMTENGKGVMAFSLMGADHYPSAAYATIDGNGVGAIHVIAEGRGPADGFTGYKAFGDPPRPRWGDYGAAATDGKSVWVASEYIGQSCTLAQYASSSPTSPLFSCGATRVTLGNWFTRISRLQP